MSRKSIAYTRGYERSDFSELLMALQTERQEMAVGAEEDQAVISAPCTEISTTEESAERHRIVSDQRIKYLYSKQDNVIHDKHCSSAKNIPDEELQWSGEYVPELQPCPVCMLQAYVSEGAKDPKEIDDYLIFFKRAKMTREQIRDMYVGCHMKTRISTDTMTVWYRDDVWRIKCLPQKEHVQLYHNNYTVRKKGVREFTQGFHIQNSICADTDIKYALGIIKHYKYEPKEYALHNKKVYANEQKMKQLNAERRELSAVSLEAMLGEKTGEGSVWQRIKALVWRIFKKPNFFELNDFHLVSEYGYPKDQTICIYFWQDDIGQMSWQTGIYKKQPGHFSVVDLQIV